jgi:hypothetical protein
MDKSLNTKTVPESLVASVSESTLTVPDIRNKLSPTTTLIAMIERGEMELAKQAIEQSKISINYLAQREVYSH